MLSRIKISILLAASLLSSAAFSDPFRPRKNQQSPPISINIGLGVSHGGEVVGGIILTPVGGGNYYTEDYVTLGGEQSYFLGCILSLGSSAELWLSYGQMYDESKPGQSHVQVADPNFDVRLDHDRIEAMYFIKSNNVRFGAGAIMDNSIRLKYKDSFSNDTFKFDNAKGWGLGIGLDMPLNEEGTALHFDARYIRMTYTIETFELNANSIGYFLTLSF